MKKSITFQGKKKTLLIGVILGLILLTAFLFVFIKNAENFIPSSQPSNSNNNTDFGNETIGGCIYADAQLITRSGRRTEVNQSIFKTQASPPSIILNSTFDTSFTWNASSVSIDSSQGYFLSEGSLNFHPNSLDTAYISYMLDENVLNDNMYKIVFWINISDTLLSSDYFILRITFSNGNALVYLLNGSYTPSITERKIDITADVIRKNDWNGIELIGIEQDYKNQFGSSSVPSFALFEFVYSRGNVGNVKINIDEFLFIRTPIQTDNFWIDNNNMYVIYAVVEVQWNITTSEFINKSNVWLKLELKVQLENDTNAVIIPWQIAQVDLFKVTQFNTRVNWTSRTFALPRDNTVYGDIVKYNWTIQAEAYGQINHTSNWALANGKLEGFDIFRIRWFIGTGEINVELYVVVGTFGAVGILGAIGVKGKKNNDTILNNMNL